jgi:hypothetical protein
MCGCYRGLVILLAGFSNLVALLRLKVLMFVRDDFEDAEEKDWTKENSWHNSTTHAASHRESRSRARGGGDDNIAASPERVAAPEMPDDRGAEMP